MPDKDLQNPGNLLRDIWRETSPVMGLSVLLGTTAGLILGVYLFQSN